MEKEKMHNMISAAIFAGIMAILSQFTFPIGPVPITLQSFVCALAGGVLALDRAELAGSGRFLADMRAK